MSPQRRPIADRFEERVMRDPNSGCWLWMGQLDRKGYGQIASGGREGGNIYAHRLSLELSGINVPANKLVCHKCDNPPCVNPAHLFVGSQSDNIADMWGKGRRSRESVSRQFKGKKQEPHRIRRGESHWNYGSRADACKNGHAFTDENTMFGSDGARRCRACRNERSRIRMNAKYRAKKDTKL